MRPSPGSSSSGPSIVSGNGGITVTYDPLNDPAQRIGSAYLQWAMPRLSK
jgi:hypothetical protein